MLRKHLALSHLLTHLLHSGNAGTAIPCTCLGHCVGITLWTLILRWMGTPISGIMKAPGQMACPCAALWLDFLRA